MLTIINLKNEKKKSLKRKKARYIKNNFLDSNSQARNILLILLRCTVAFLFSNRELFYRKNLLQNQKKKPKEDCASRKSFFDFSRSFLDNGGNLCNNYSFSYFFFPLRALENLYPYGSLLITRNGFFFSFCRSGIMLYSQQLYTIQ